MALFNIAIDSKLRGCDPANLRVRDVMHAGKHHAILSIEGDDALEISEQTGI
jgi:hypothetical protein